MIFCTDLTLDERCLDCPLNGFTRELQPDEELALRRGAHGSFVEADREDGDARRTHVAAIMKSIIATEPASYHMDNLTRDIAVHRAIGLCVHHEGAVVENFEPNTKSTEEIVAIIDKFKLKGE